MTETKSQCRFFNYSDIYLGKMEEEYVTLEEFVPGDFVTYIDNTGEICSISDMLTHIYCIRLKI